MNGLGKPGAREPHARFDEGRLETEPWSRDRSACNEVRGQRRTKAATAPVSHSTCGAISYERAERHTAYRQGGGNPSNRLL